MLESIADSLAPLENRTPNYATGTVTVLAGTTATICTVTVLPIINDTNLIDYVAGAGTGTKIPSVGLKRNGVLIDTGEMGSLTKYLDITATRSVTYEVQVNNSGGAIDVTCSGIISVIQF